jgi:hypothetical protein
VQARRAYPQSAPAVPGQPLRSIPQVSARPRCPCSFRYASGCRGLARPLLRVGCKERSQGAATTQQQTRFETTSQAEPTRASWRANRAGSYAPGKASGPPRAKNARRPSARHAPRYATPPPAGTPARPLRASPQAFRAALAQPGAALRACEGHHGPGRAKVGGRVAAKNSTPEPHSPLPVPAFDSHLSAVQKRLKLTGKVPMTRV